MHDNRTCLRMESQISWGIRGPSSYKRPVRMTRIADQAASGRYDESSSSTRRAYLATFRKVGKVGKLMTNVRGKIEPLPVKVNGQTDLTIRRSDSLVSSATIARYKGQIAKAGSKRAALSRIKGSISLEHIPSFIREVSRFPFYRDLIAPASFPHELENLKSVDKVLEIHTLQRELIWTASVLKLFTNELSQFLTLEQAFHNAQMRDNVSDALSILKTIQGEFGLSIWLIENTIASVQKFFGLETQKRYSYDIITGCRSQIIRYLTYYYSVRAEDNVSSTTFYNLFTSELADDQHNNFREYLLSDMLPISDFNFNKPEVILGYSETSPIIDRYLSFIKASQIACAISAAKQDPAILTSIRTALTLTELSIPDFRLENLRYVIKGGNPEIDCAHGARVMYVYDEYTRGEYASAVQAATSLINEHPTRVDLIEISIKSAAQIASKHANPDGRLHTHILNVLLRNDSYTESVEVIKNLL